MFYPKRRSQERVGSRFCVAVFVAAAICIVGLYQTPASGVAKEEGSRAADQLVRKALRAEVDGSPGHDELLQAALEQSPDHEAARWHTGHVRLQKKWVHIDEVPKQTGENRQVTTYRRIREKWPKTAEGHGRAAAWCAKRGLVDQQRAHLTKVLEYAPNDADARAKLGYVYAAGAWLSPAEMREAGARVNLLMKSMVRWKPKLQSIRRGLGGQYKEQWKRDLKRQEALEQWEAIDDPAAIPAMELVFSADRNPEWAMKVVEKLGEMNVHEAAVSLVRHAVFARSAAVRRKAVEKLKSRPYDDYVPVLLSALRAPVQTRAALYRTPDGRLLHRQMFYREGQEHKDLAVLDTAFSYFPTPDGDRRTALAQALSAAYRAWSASAAAAQQQNVISRQFNYHICSVLSAATGQDVPPSPESWWQWWNDYNEVFVAGDKPFRPWYGRQEVGVTGYTPRPRPTGGISSGALAAGRALRRSDCLAAGTRVWTELGPVSIEQIKVGDRVLSQDPETGELAYKPVLRTTIRPAGKMFKVEASDESIEANGGHRFWIVGKGWIRARELEPGTHLHGVTSTVEVRSVEQHESKQSYNLIVADFHTYFVGETKILSHDNTIIKPTNSVVPGLKGP